MIHKLKINLQEIKILRSLRFRIFFLIFLMGFLSCFIMRVSVVQNYFDREINMRKNDVQNQLKIIANHLITYNYLEDPSSEVINAELEQMSNLYDGRVLIMDRSFRVIKDTYGLSVGKYLVAEEVIRCFRGEILSNYDDNNQYIEIAVPITQTITDDVTTDGREAERTEVVGVMLTSVSVDGIVKNQDILNRQGVIIQILLLIVIFGIAVGVSKIILKPFDRVTEAISAVKEGYTDEKIAVNDYVETEHIVDAFNQLLGRMKVLDDSRQEFVANVSHELKTPMTSVKVLADSLNSQDDVPVELYREFMNDITAEIDRENKIINDLLSLVKMDKTNQDLHIEAMDINKLLEAIFKRLHPIAKEGKIDLILESHRQVTAEVDEVRISLAFTNLIENAIKYNKEEGWVKVVLDADHQFFTVEVSDSGIGIAETEQKHIFERFYRVDKSHSREIGGTGLGLAITRSAILVHRGSIRINSEEGVGTTFTVKIPLTYIA